jgi:hypothetical protein
MTSSVKLRRSRRGPPRSQSSSAERPLERRLADRPAGGARLVVVDVERSAAEARIIAIGFADVLALSAGAGAVRRLGHERARRVVLV